MRIEEFRKEAEAALPGPDGIIVDPSWHHGYCQYYREGSECTCVEGREPGYVTVPADMFIELLDKAGILDV